MATAEDYGKYFCALASRSVRRVAAKVHAANLDHLFDATDGKIDAEYYKRLAEHFEQRSGRPYTMQMAIGFEARMGKLCEDMTDGDWDRLAETMLTKEQCREVEEETR
jgi:23S rRNA maturation mini-RNase III